MPGENEIRPWDRREDETSKAYGAFVTYRDLGPERSLEKVAHTLGKSTTIMSRWSAQHEWVSRTVAWDNMPGRKVEEAYEEMAGRIAAQHDQVATKLLARLNKNLDLLQEGKDPSQNWSLAHSAARQGHQFAAELVKPRDEAKAAITDAIENLISKLAGEE